MEKSSSTIWIFTGQMLYKYKEGSLCFNIQFFVEKMKKVKKNVKKFDTPQLGFEPQILEQNIPAQDLNFEGRLDQSSSRFFKNLDFTVCQSCSYL